MIVATLLEPHLAGLQEAMAACDPTSDAFEVRFDALRETVDPGDVRNLTRKPLIGTVRRQKEGGRSAATEEQRGSLLQACVDSGFEFVDVELDVDTKLPPERLIRSHHDLRGTPGAPTVLQLAAALDRSSVFKFASQVRAFSDSLQLLMAQRGLQRAGVRSAVMGMGEFPRALTHLLGADLWYGGGRSNAPGQPPHADLTKTLNHWGAPKPAARLGLVVGDPVDHSLSPRLQNAAFQQMRADANFGALRIRSSTELQLLLDRAQPLGLLGLSVTTPLKDAAFELCTQRAPEAEAARAVNCIRFDGNNAVGHNTDGVAAAAIASRLATMQDPVLLIGTGGAARAFISQWPSKQLTVAGRTPQALRSLQKQHGCKTIPLSLAAEELPRQKLVINASRETEPVGLERHDGAVFDFHYGEAPTPWETVAKRRGLKFAGGRELLLEQGVRAFRLWTGEDPDIARMRAVLEASP
jgi:shikimate dehydrogenase